MTAVYGTQARSVKVFEKKDVLTCVVRYDGLDVTLTYLEAWDESKYVAYVNFKDDFIGEVFYPIGLYGKEFMEFYHLLKGEPQPQSYEEFFAPVYICNAIEKSRLSGKEELIVFWGKNMNILTTPSHVFLVVKKADSVGCCGNTIFITQWVS